MERLKTKYPPLFPFFLQFNYQISGKLFGKKDYKNSRKTTKKIHFQ